MAEENTPRKSTLENIASIVGNIAGEVYGVVALSPNKNIVDDIQILLKKENYRDGIKVLKLSKDTYEVTIYCVLASGVKVNEVIVELQEQVKYALEKKLHISFKKVNVFVRGVK